MFIFRALWVVCRPFGYEDWMWRGLKGPPILYSHANAITMARAKAVLYVAPVLYGTYEATGSVGFLWATIGLLVVCGALDGIDGLVARKFNCITKVGRYLDPMADSINIFYGFRVLAGEYDFDPQLLIPFVGIVALGAVIFRKRLRDPHVRTHWLAKGTILAVYAGGVILLFGIVAKVLGDHNEHELPQLWGFRLFWLALGMMFVSLLWYYRHDIRFLPVRWRWRRVRRIKAAKTARKSSTF